MTAHIELVCPLCGVRLKPGKGVVKGHIFEAHADMLDIYPNPFIPKENIIWVSD